MVKSDYRMCFHTKSLSSTGLLFVLCVVVNRADLMLWGMAEEIAAQ